MLEGTKGTLGKGTVQKIGVRYVSLCVKLSCVRPFAKRPFAKRPFGPLRIWSCRRGARKGADPGIPQHLVYPLRP